MIFFLDMDGVVNNPRVAFSLPSNADNNMFGWFDPISVNFINKWAEVIKEVGDDETYIVVSSTWRIGQTYMGMNQLFGAADILPLLHPDWCTRRAAMTVGDVVDIRGFQIRDWLDDHPEEQNWMIIDDSSDFTEDQRPRHVHTDSTDGILYQHHVDALRIIDQIYQQPD